MIGTEGGKLNKLFFLILCAGAIGCQTHEQRAKRIYQSEFVYKSGDDRSQLPDFSKTDIVAKNLGVASEKVENMPDKKAYLSFDIDVLSSEYVKATGTSSARGLTPQFIHKALDSIRGKINIIGADFVELAPSLCRGDFNEPQRSLDIACSITNQIISLLSN